LSYSFSTGTWGIESSACVGCTFRDITIHTLGIHHQFFTSSGHALISPDCMIAPSLPCDGYCSAGLEPVMLEPIAAPVSPYDMNVTCLSCQQGNFYCIYVLDL
jgi:hypothetical protein